MKAPVPSLLVTPSPPYFAVIFSSVRTELEEGYAAIAARMLALAAEQAGFLGYEGARAEGIGVSVSYWSTEEAILAWRRNAEHREAQRDIARWYRIATVRVCRVERSYTRPAEQSR